MTRKYAYIAIKIKLRMGVFPRGTNISITVFNILLVDRVRQGLMKDCASGAVVPVLACVTA